MVSQFEREFAAYVGAKFAVSASNGTVTLQAALVALGVKPGDRVATTPLTMAATSIAILNVGAVPVYCDVDARTWLMDKANPDDRALLGVSLYGLHWRGAGHDYRDGKRWRRERGIIDDAAQTLAPYRDGAYGGAPDFKSYSLQRSKILNTGEGGVLVTDDEALAMVARSYLSLGYQMSATQARIDSAAIKASDYARHHRYPAINGRMNDVTAALGLERLAHADRLLAERREAAALYVDAIAGCDWLAPQYVPEGWSHDYWTFAVACDTPERARWLQAAVEQMGGERPYAAWRLTYQEPAFAHLDPRPTDYEVGSGGPVTARGALCPNAESLQPRLLQFQTNDLASAERNAKALRLAIQVCEPVVPRPVRDDRRDNDRFPARPL